MIVRNFIGGLTLGCLSATASANCFRTEWDVSTFAGETTSSSEYTPPDDFISPGLLAPLASATPVAASSIDPIVGTDRAGEDFDGFSVGGEFFFAGVGCDNGPLKEAAFLGQASSVGGGYTQFETDDDVETDSFNIFARVVVNTWVGEAEIRQSEVDGDFIDADVDSFRLAGGKYLQDAMQLLVSYENTDFEGSEADRFAVEFKAVVQLDNGQSYTANAIAGYTDIEQDFGSDDDSIDLTFVGDWFFNDQFSIGTELEFADRDESVFNWQLNSTYFFTDKISLALAYSAFDEDDLLATADDQFTLEFNYRR